MIAAMIGKAEVIQRKPLLKRGVAPERIEQLIQLQNDQWKKIS